MQASEFSYIKIPNKGFGFMFVLFVAAFCNSEHFREEERSQRLSY
jgi:hypothetical protein